MKVIELESMDAVIFLLDSEQKPKHPFLLIKSLLDPLCPSPGLQIKMQ
jgi:hypothetical protein